MSKANFSPKIRQKQLGFLRFLTEKTLILDSLLDIRTRQIKLDPSHRQRKNGKTVHSTLWSTKVVSVF